MRWWRAAVPCTSPFLWGDRPRSVTHHHGWDGLPCSRKSTHHLPGYFCFPHRNELLTLSTESLLGSEHTAPAHRAAPREPASSRGRRNHSQAAMGGSCPNTPSGAVADSELNFISRVTSSRCQPIPSLPTAWAPELWGVWGKAMGSVGDTQSLPGLCHHPGLNPSQETRAQSSWWWLL